LTRHYLIASGDQRPDQQPPVGLDPDHHLRWLLRPGGNQLVQPGHPGHPVSDPLAGQHAPVGRHHAHIMVALGPINPNQ